MSKQRIRLMVIDENPSVQAALHDRLSREHELDLLGIPGNLDGDKLLAQIRTLQPDVVIFEYRRSDGRGLALCQKMLALENNPVVIVYSSLLHDNDRLAVESLGVEHLVHKEISSNRLIKQIYEAYAERHP